MLQTRLGQGLGPRLLTRLLLQNVLTLSWQGTMAASWHSESFATNEYHCLPKANSACKSMETLRDCPQKPNFQASLLLTLSCSTALSLVIILQLLLAGAFVHQTVASKLAVVSIVSTDSDELLLT